MLEELESFSLLAAFAAGTLSFLSPCVLPLVPGYIANLAGSSMTASKTSPWITFSHALSFVIGFSLVFILLGALAGQVGAFSSAYMPLLYKIAGGLLILFGLHLIGVFRIPFLYYEKRLSYPKGNTPSYLRSFLIGSAFSLGWIPCVGPILGGILALAWTSQTVWQGVYLLSAYSLGLGVPFLILGLAFAPATGYLKRLNRHLNIISVISGVLLIVIGVLIFTNNLVELNKYIGIEG
jgi:cytochrome c-type biogenesis protein